MTENNYCSYSTDYLFNPRYAKEIGYADLEIEPHGNYQLYHNYQTSYQNFMHEESLKNGQFRDRNIKYRMIWNLNGEHVITLKNTYNSDIPSIYNKFHHIQMLTQCKCLFCIYKVLTCHCISCVDTFQFYDLPTNACSSIIDWKFFLNKSYICCCIFHPCKSLVDTCWCIRCTFYIKNCECKMCLKRKDFSEKISNLHPKLDITCKHLNCSSMNNIKLLYNEEIIQDRLQHHNIFINELQELQIHDSEK